MAFRLIGVLALTASAALPAMAQSAGAPGPSSASSPVAIPRAAVPDLSAAPIWALPQLTGNWGGARTYLSDRGVTFAFEYTSFFQGLVGGADLDGNDVGLFRAEVGGWGQYPGG